MHRTRTAADTLFYSGRRGLHHTMPMRRSPTAKLARKDQLLDRTTPPPGRRLERSVDSLERIFAFIVALAVTDAIKATFVDKNAGTLILSWPAATLLPAFLAFLVTIVPFYHGMNRHLDECYIRRTPPAEGALLFDFIVFFIEASLLFAITASLGRTDLISFVFLGILLTVDTVWALISNWIHYSGEAQGIKKWAAVNAATIAFGVFLVPISAAADLSTEWQAWLLLALALVRSVLDYSLTWTFYFPQEVPG